MTRSIDFTVIDNLRVSASRGQHAHVIQETIVIDNELQNLQLHLLDLRARSYVACAKFNNALETATKMQQINPATALGYLSQGYIHMEQGRYIAATHVYDTALERVDKHDPLYDTIHTAKAKAMQQGEKRTDFICDLPMDISDRVIKEVLQHGVYDQQREYVMVSSAWWHRIMATDRLEYIIRGGLPLTESSEAVIQSFEHTRSLTLKYCKQPLGDLFKKYPFSSLTTLAVYASKIGPFGESISALQWIGSQVTDLTLVYQPNHVIRVQQDYGVRLQYVLKMCPNLKSLHCEATIYISRIEEVYSKLKRLILYGVRGRVDREQMRMMRDHLPGLKTLEMAITDSSKPLTMDDSWLPCIRHLGYSDRPNTDHLDYVQRQSGEQEGLVSFSITDINYQFPLDDIAPIIIHHHATLQYLEFMSNLSTTDTRKMMDAMKKDQHIEFKQLKVLQVYTLFTPSDLNTIQPFCSFINWVIQRAPYLQLADLKGYTMNRSSLKALSNACIYAMWVSKFTRRNGLMIMIHSWQTS
ncbi:predicted protein [Lichtheimia corymbifera JMRC:FSU:9682]|uniref:Uncharacterized protein n=1 Tax=Lichtheimia corymbifera JMRC:FSU:9682 TaxID=1263082 RepID=A0A068SAJ1_9FUNG|nr:predicted protein [Lichtheimia corymbifera JMRC:FSU:9682]